MIFYETARMITCDISEKHLPLRKTKEAQATINRKKITIFCSINCNFSFFFFFFAISNDQKKIAGFSLIFLKGLGFLQKKTRKKDIKIEMMCFVTFRSLFTYSTRTYFGTSCNTCIIKCDLITCCFLYCF